MEQSLSKERDGDNGAEEGFIPIRDIKNKLRKTVPIRFGRLILVLVTVIVIIGITVIVTAKLFHRHQSSYTNRPTCIQPQEGFPAIINVSNTTGTIYELFTESFLDSSEKGGGKAGDGTGDINGIKACLDYLKDIGSRSLYINSLYESNDNDHMAVVDHKIIDHVYGTMRDFDQLIQDTKNKKMSVIMDFIPNHTGKESVWFQQSQRREGKYAYYYIWAPCDPVSGTYINNWLSVKGGRAWTYDKIRKECYLHQLEGDKPDLNLTNSDVIQELKNILHFWLNKGVDGFHVQNVQYLYEDQDLRNETLIPGKTGNAYDDFDHIQTRNHPENAKLLQSWKHVLDTFSPKSGRKRVLVVTTGNDIDAAMKYLDAGVNIVRVNLLSGKGTSLAECMETILKLAACKMFAWMYSDKDSSRLASRVGPENVKAFLTIQATVPGIPFNYYGNEIGMTDHPTHSGRWKYRTPMQWDRNGTGFSQNPPWLTQNPNHKTVNVESELSSEDNFTTLKVYRRLQELRRRESFQWGETRVFREGDLLMYTRKAEGFPGYLVAVNLGKDEVTIESLLAATGIPKEVKVVFHTHQTIQDTDISRSMEKSYMLGLSQGVILEYP